MKGRILLFIFALPFFGVGLWMLWSIGTNVADSWSMRNWQPAEARIIEGGYHSHSGDDSYTYEAYATYTYQYQGQQFTNHRVAIADGSDNIGDYQQDMGRRLSNAWSNREPVTIYVNPDKPSDAIIDRDLRWGLIGFKSVFLFVFGGAGLGLIIWSIKAPKQKDAADPRYSGKPWLMNDDWQTNTIRSNSKKTMYFTWGFAAFWNLISAPLPFLAYTEVVEKQNYAALLGLLFTLVGVYLIVWAVRSTREWRRFGPAPVTLDPFPGSIGGHVGGTIDIRLPYDSSTNIALTLTNIRSYVSGTGKNRSRREKAEWQDKQLAHMESSPSGTRVSFRFDVPDHLDESDADQSEDEYHLWRLNLKAEIPGADIDRDYEIPVYATAQESRHISHRAIETARSQTDALDEQAVRDAVRLRNGIDGTEMLYPMGRNLGSFFGGFIVGTIFTGAGWWVAAKEGAWIFGSIFAVVGFLIQLFSLYSALNSLQVVKSASELRTVRRILGIPVKRSRMRTDQIRELSKKTSHKTQSGSRHTVFYSICAIGNDGHKMVIGEGFKGESEADAAIRILSREFGITPAEARPDLPRDVEFDVLAADN